MTIRTNQKWNTDQWPGVERMHPPPDWFGVSPEVVKRRGKLWNQDPTDVPWLDRDDAEEQIESRHDQGLITSEEAELLRQRARDGYFVLENAIEESDHGLIDDYVRDVDGIWTTEEELPGLQVMSLHIKDRPSGPVEHHEILSWPLDKRIEMRDSQLWRVHYFHRHSRAAMELSKAPRILRMCSLLLDEHPVPLSAICFKWGSHAGVHQDLGTMHVHPANRLVGLWIACQDVDPDSGPLWVMPGTHRIPLWPGFTNYPQTNLRTLHLDLRRDEEKYLADAVEGCEKKPMVIKKGDAVFTHGLLVHGGDKIKDRNKTRFSYVVHYTVPGGDKMHEVEGPFNW